MPACESDSPARLGFIRSHSADPFDFLTGYPGVIGVVTDPVLDTVNVP